MKLGILGTGMIVQDFLHTIDRLAFEKVYILGTERSHERTERLVEQYGLNGIFYDYDELLAGDVDTVYVALPNHLHYPFAKKALQAGKHAIIEKPVTSNVRELEDLVKTAEENSVMLFEAVNFCYNPVFRHLREDVKKLGRIKIANFHYSQYSSRYDAFKAGEMPPVFDYRKSGGCLMDINLYNVNMAVRLFGAPEELRYMANVERNIDTSGVLLMRYPGFVAVCVGAKDCGGPNLSTIQGELGTIEIPAPPNVMTGYRICYTDGRSIEVDADTGEHRLYNEFQEFKNIAEIGDYGRCCEMLQSSLRVVKVLECARKQEKILFAADEDGACC